MGFYYYLAFTDQDFFPDNYCCFVLYFGRLFNLSTVQIQSTLNFSGVTFKFYTVAMFIVVDLQRIFDT
jgi:hypothetical protein